MAPATDEVDELLPDEPDAKAAAEARIGQIVAGTYRIARYIGSGGSSHVYEAEHVRLGKPFAVKLLRPELGNGRKTAQRFRREAKAIARLQNEHIISVMDSGELEDQTPYLVMELLQGEDLRSLLEREGQLPARRAVQIALEACRGLTAVHQAGLVHRDLKPENLFITRRSTGEDWCKVLDFGVVKMEASQSTAQGAIIGTVRYMAPEQLADGAAVGPATDVYAVGAILYECLSGAPLIDGSSVQEVMYQVMNVEPKALASLRPELPELLFELVHWCVAKAPADRPQGATELGKLLQKLLATEPRDASDSTVAEDSPVMVPSGWRRQQRYGRRLIPIAAAALLLAAGAGWALRGAAFLAPASDMAKHPVTTQASVVRVEQPTASPAPASPVPPATDALAQSAIAAPPAASSAPPAKPALRHTGQPTPGAARTPAGQPATVGRFDNANPYE